MINCVYLKSQPENKWLLFKDPLEVIETYSTDMVLSSLYKVNHMVKDYGLYAAGFISYEAAPAFDESFKVLDDNKFPKIWFALYKDFEEIEKPSSGSHVCSDLKWTAEIDYEHYSKEFDRIKKYLQAGHTYQVNYTFRLRTQFDHDPLSFFSDMLTDHEPPYAAFINTDTFAICSFSPELFFNLDGLDLLSKPMKGTCSRKCMYWDDLLQARKLNASIKNRAENVMITDMVRNDLGRMAEPGSVDVQNLFTIEKYSHVWQMTSQVKCRTAANIPAIMTSLFPSSSITGAPKSSTTKIISEVETSPRRIYTGCIGYWGPERKSQFNIAIRTVLVDKEKNRAEYGVGGGIVWDSKVLDEWQECKDKAETLNRKYPRFSLLETILWTKEGGYHLKGSHLNRLRSTAAFFSFTVDIGEIDNRLESFSRSFHQSNCKVRLLVSANGELTIERIPLVPLGNPIKISLAQKPVDSSDPFLYHKTTYRKVYENASPQKSEADNVVLWNDKGEITETTFANIVVRIGSSLYTPPVRCGLLAGTYRHFLLSSGVIRERVILKEELSSCSEVFLVNSVRGYLRAVLI